MAVGRPAAKGPVILQPPAGGYRVRLATSQVDSQLGWKLAEASGDVDFHSFVVEPGEVWCAPASLRGPSGKHPMERWVALAQDTSHIPEGVVDDVSELVSLGSTARTLVPGRYEAFKGIWSESKGQKHFLLKLNKSLGSELGWEPQRKTRGTDGPKMKARKIALVSMGGILALLSADRYNELRSEPFEQWLEDEV
jgi:hypothetical protein